MSLEQAIQQYGGVGLLIWLVTLTIPIAVAWWRAGIRAQNVVTEERRIIHNMLKRRDEDARTQGEKTDKLEGEVFLLKSTMSIEREEADAQIEDLQNQLNETKAARERLQERLEESERSYHAQLNEATAQIAELRKQIAQLEEEMRSMEHQRQTLVDQLFEEMRRTADLTREVAFLRGERDFAERVLAKVQPTSLQPEVSYNPSPV